MAKAKEQLAQERALVVETPAGIMVRDWSAFLKQQGSRTPNPRLETDLSVILSEAGVAAAIYAAAIELVREKAIIEERIAVLERELADRTLFANQQSALVASHAGRIAAGQKAALALHVAFGGAPICPCGCPSCGRNNSGDLGAVCYHAGVAAACGGH
jgi:hypothetical protein